MHNFKTKHARLLARYPRAIVHLRSQVSLQRFGLVFGSGLSKSLGLPTWADLVECLAADPEVNGNKLMKRVSPRQSLSYKTELLFQHYRVRKLPKSRAFKGGRLFEYPIIASWLKLIAKHLYQDLGDIDSALRHHPYLSKYLPLVRNSHMTVTYNFDTLLERALASTRTPEERKEARGYETVTNPWTQFRRQKAVIYHPNGVIPDDLMETPADRIVFSESSFADQFIGIIAGDYSGLRDHFARNTCLFVGLSLEDEMLRSVLIQNAQSNPGNYHYYVSFVGDHSSTRDAAHRKAIEQANFKVYNLITLFLNKSELATLAELLYSPPATGGQEAAPDAELSDFAKENSVGSAFRFYMTGPLGVGKTTTINYFRNLFVLDEWMEPRLEILAKFWDDLSPPERRKADRWIARQFKLKNDQLRNRKLGIYMLDRTPLDPLAFAEESQWPKRARALLKEIAGNKGGWSVEPGKVIVLDGDPDELATRLLLTGRKDYTAARLSAMATKIATLLAGRPGVTRIDTRGLSAAEVAKRVAAVVHLEDYQECRIQERLEELKSNPPNAG
jgi:SIR2-like domain